MSADAQKQAAAEAAMDYVKDGMNLGLGTGSTAEKFVDLLGERVKAGLKVTCVATSEATKNQAENLGIDVSDLNLVQVLDLTVDGADEIDSKLRLIKGGGGAHLREKIVAAASKKMLVIADQSKKVEMLGKFALPVEVFSFGAVATLQAIAKASQEAGCSGQLHIRKNAEGRAFLTDNKNLICDCSFGEIPDPEQLSFALSTIPGVAEHGLFINIAKIALIGTPEGVETLHSCED